MRDLQQKRLSQILNDQTDGQPTTNNDQDTFANFRAQRAQRAQRLTQINAFIERQPVATTDTNVTSIHSGKLFRNWEDLSSQQRNDFARQLNGNGYRSLIPFYTYFRNHLLFLRDHTLAKAPGGKPWDLHHIMEQRWREAQKTINEQIGELEYGTTSRRTEKTPTPTQLWNLQETIKSSKDNLAKEKEQYNRVVEAYWKLWVETQKCIVIGLQEYETNFVALCLWKREGKLETIERSVTRVWIENQYGKDFTKSMVDATEEAAKKDEQLFYPTNNNNDYHGWILSEPVFIKGIWYIGQEAVSDSSDGLPGDSQKSNTTEFEYELTNGDVLPIKNKRVSAEYGVGFVDSCRNFARTASQKEKEPRDDDGSRYKSGKEYESEEDDHSSGEYDTTKDKSETKIPASVTTDGNVGPNASDPPPSSPPNDTKEDKRKPEAIETTNNPTLTPPHNPLASTTSSIATASRERASVNDNDNDTVNDPPLPPVLGQVIPRPPLSKALESLLAATLTLKQMTQPPLIHYKATATVNCAFASTASVLHHVGLTDEARCVMDAASSFTDPQTQDPLLLVRDALKGKDDNGKTRFGHMQFCTLTPENFCLLGENNKLRRLENDVLFLLAIRNKDNTNTSVVSIFDGWIHDANMGNAVPLNYDFMCHIMSTMVPDPTREGTYITTKGNFTGIQAGYAFYECRSNIAKNFMKSAGSAGDVTGSSERPLLDLSAAQKEIKVEKNKETNRVRKDARRSRSYGNRRGEQRGGRQRGEQQGDQRQRDERRGRQPQRQSQQRGRKRQRDDSRSDNEK